MEFEKFMIERESWILLLGRFSGNLNLGLCILGNLEVCLLGTLSLDLLSLEGVGQMLWAELLRG